jgi:curved DNA-binding protein CbpA
MQLTTFNVPQLFYEGFHSQAGQPGARLLQSCLDKYLILDRDYYRHINFLHLNDDEKRFVHGIDGRHRLSELVADQLDCGPLLLTMTTLNMARFSPEPAVSADPENLPLRTLFNVVEEEVEVVIEDSLESFTDLVDDGDDDFTPVEPATFPPESAIKEDQHFIPDDLAQEVRLIARSLENQNHYEVFGIKQGKFSIDRLKERYFAITRKLGPEVLMQLGGEEAALAEQILSRVATAYDTLSDVVKKERYDEMLGADKVGLGQKGDERFQAQVQAESGKVFLAMDEWDNAEKSLQDAVNAEPNNGSYLAHLAWAIYRNPKYSSSEAMMNKAKQMLNKAITMERTASAFAYKGLMLFESGQESMAEAEFNKALKLDERQELARKGLRTLHEHQEQQKKGLFKRMFK